MTFRASQTREMQKEFTDKSEKKLENEFFDTNWPVTANPIEISGIDLSIF